MELRNQRTRICCLGQVGIVPQHPKPGDDCALAAQQCYGRSQTSILASSVLALEAHHTLMEIISFWSDTGQNQ